MIDFKENLNDVEAFHYRLLQGELFADPHVNSHTGRATMRVMAWNSGEEMLDIIDTKVLPGEYESVHAIPTKVLDCVFFGDSEHTGIQFSQGGTYALESGWLFPFPGARYGAWVKRYDANANRGSNNEHAGAANA
jgi:hypothetical protein